jgi:hypothetical protein
MATAERVGTRRVNRPKQLHAAFDRNVVAQAAIHNRRTAKEHEELAPTAISHDIGRPLDRFLRGPVRCHPQPFDDFIQYRMA